MKIIIFVDDTPHTEQLLKTVKVFVGSFASVEITVLHVMDMRLFNASTGFEVQLTEALESESATLKSLCIQYLGQDVSYWQEYGIPILKIEEMIGQTDHDLLVIGNHVHPSLGERIVGSIAAHLLRESAKPVLIIPYN